LGGFGCEADNIHIRETVSTASATEIPGFQPRAPAQPRNCSPARAAPFRGFTRWIPSRQLHGYSIDSRPHISSLTLLQPVPPQGHNARTLTCLASAAAVANAGGAKPRLCCECRPPCWCAPRRQVPVPGARATTALSLGPCIFDKQELSDSIRFEVEPQLQAQRVSSAKCRLLLLLPLEISCSSKGDL
jgi:hypothetical protein